MADNQVPDQTANAQALVQTARRFLDLGADFVGVLIPMADGETAELVLGFRFDGGIVVDPNSKLEDALRCSGVEEEAYTDAVQFARKDWDRTVVRMFAARRVREGTKGHWNPDVQWPPEPVPNVDLSR